MRVNGVRLLVRDVPGAFELTRHVIGLDGTHDQQSAVASPVDRAEWGIRTAHVREAGGFNWPSSS